MLSIRRDIGADIPILLLTGASAALGIVRRRGLGRIRHLDVTDLWIQEQVRSKEMDIQKVAGTENIADALTKMLPRPDLVKHMKGMNLYPEEGRAETAPELTT